MSILITGASHGIGEATARRFAKDGNCRLILTGRHRDTLEKVAASLDVPTHVLVFDVCDELATQNALSSIPEEFAVVDVLVNNAGAAFGMDKAHVYSLSDWHAMVDVNIKGLLNCTHAILPGMVKRNRGHVVNLGSIAATYPYTGGNVYGATKAFVAQFTKNLRADVLGTNVRVTVVEPGLVETDFFATRFKRDMAKVAKIFEGAQALQASDIAEAVVWAVKQPPHVNVSVIEVMPTCQAPSSIAVDRKK